MFKKEETTMIETSKLKSYIKEHCQDIKAGKVGTADMNALAPVVKYKITKAEPCQDYKKFSE